MTWLLPELELGVELELMPLELELPELEVPELEVPELEVPELGEAEAEAAGDFADVDVEPVDDEPDTVVVLWVEPGKAKARTPVATTLTALIAVVAERTLRRPFCRSTMARRMPSRCAFMSLILWSGLRKSLHGPSR